MTALPPTSHEDPAIAQEVEHPTVTKPRVTPTIASPKLQSGFNRRLLLLTLVVGSVIFLMGFVSYRIQSARTADSFLRQAAAAREAGNFVDEAMWLSRYSLLHPEDAAVILDRAIASDNAASAAVNQERLRLVETARRQLGQALSLVRTLPDQANREPELRRRLIERLVELGGAWLKEAQRQVVMLDAPVDDADAIRWLAMSMNGQFKANTHQPERNLDQLENVSNWRWLAAQNIGDILQLAVIANPRDPALAGALVELYLNQKNAFSWSEATVESSDGEPSKTAALEMRQAIEALPNPELQISELIGYLTERVEDGHSQWIVIQYFRRLGDTDRAQEVMLKAAEKAIERLEGNLARQETPADEIKEVVETSDKEQQDRNAWDTMIVMDAAESSVQRNEYNAASDLFRRLTMLDHTKLPADLVERAFLGYGQTWLFLKDSVKATEVWTAGINQIQGEPLDLLRANATTLIYEGEDLEKALSSIKRFSDAIDRATIRLSRSSDADLVGTSRQGLSNRIDAAKWHLSVLKAKHHERSGETDSAVDLMDQALQSTVFIPNDVRARVATDLSQIHAKRGLWDLAGLALEKAITYRPNDRELRDAAVAAWLRVGNRSRALRHRQEAERGDSFDSLLKSAEAQLANQLKVLPANRDLNAVRNLIRRAAELLENLAEANQDQRQEILAESWRYKVLIAYLPPQGVSLEDHLQGDELPRRLAELAKSDPSNERLQSLLAIRLHSLDRAELGNAVLSRLEGIESADQTNLAVVQAAVAALQERYQEASVKLIKRSKLDEQRSIALLNQAADYALHGQHAELAYRAIESVPESKRDVTLLRKLTSLARGVPEDSVVLQRDGKVLSPIELSSKWEAELRKAEGEKGTYWRFARATTLIYQIAVNPKETALNEARLAEVAKLQSQISAIRPVWGEGIALEGWVAAMQGNAERAVERLRLGIASGDGRIESRMLLVEQLNKLGRYDEAEMELQLAGQSVGVTPANFPEVAIDLAQRQGNFSRSVALARSYAKNRQDDAAAHLVLAQALTALASEAKQNGTDRQQIIVEAREALAKAGALSEKTDFAVASARLQLEFTHGDDQSQAEVMTEISQSDLPELQRLGLLAQAYLARGEMEQAGKAFQRVVRLAPLDPASHTKLAGYYQLIGDHEKSIQALETAYRQAPSDVRIRNQLALALATHSGAEIPWGRLQQILGGGLTTIGNAESRLLHALLLAQRGQNEQHNQASEMLQQLIDEGGDRSLEAMRLLAALNRLRWQQHPRRDASPEAQNWLDEAKGLYELLVRRRDPEPVDLYRYADLLLVADQPHDVERLLLSLQSVDRAAVAALDISLRYNLTREKPKSADVLIAKWADQAKLKGVIEMETLDRMAGFSLLKHGFMEKAIPHLESAYQTNPENIVLLVQAYLEAGKVERAQTISSDHYAKFKDAASATLLSESILSLGIVSNPLPANIETMLIDALKRFPANASLLESIGTVRLQQQNYLEAVRLFELVIKLDPDRVRTLNNLAMAYSELPSKANLGIAPIDRAIEIERDNPELLDTKGVVLMKVGDLQGAKAAFADAIRLQDDPRFQFHMIMTLRAMGAADQAREAWEALDLDQLDPSALTADERRELDTISKEFSGPSI